MKYREQCSICNMNGQCENTDIYDCVLYVDPNWFKSYHKKLQQPKLEKEKQGITKWLERFNK